MTVPGHQADVAVVGLGLIGSGALRHLATAGVDVIGVGPAEPEPDRWAAHEGVFASHYDSGRITRRLDPRFEWAELARRAINQYATIAADGGIAFHQAPGTLFASADPDRIAAIVAVAERLGSPHEVLGSAAEGLRTTDDGRVLAADGRLALPAGSTVIAEPGPAGFVDPRRMLGAQLAAAERHGARTIRERALAVEPDGHGWLIAAADGTTVWADRVLLTTGAHSDELAPAAGFAGVVRPETVVLATLGPAEQQRLAGLPSVLATLTGGSFVDLYQVPPTAYPDGTVKLKLGATLREWSPLRMGEERRAWMRGDEHRRHLPELRALVEALVPGLRAEAWDTKPCMITDTPSGLPTVDHLAPGLVLAAGGNGYAAKSADAIGALAATLLQQGRWTDPVLDSAPFALPA